MSRAAALEALGIVMALCAFPLPAHGREPAPAPVEVLIRGTVKDAEGTLLADYPVRLIKAKTILNLFRLSTASQQLEEARTQTDSEGRFEIRRVRDPKYDYFYLRFYDPKSFDPVRYRVPADLDITRRVKEGKEVVVDQIIEAHPDWPRVKQLVSEFGAESNRGRILLSLGLPERRETFANDPGRESWWYYAKGLCYQLRADDVLRVRRYDPVLPPRFTK